MSGTVPFNRPDVSGHEFRYMRQAVANGHLSGDGPWTKRCQTFLEQQLGAPKVLLVTSATHALEMAGLLIKLQPGDDVIVPSFTFVSTANAFALHGARPVFADIRPDTLNLDETQLERRLTPRTKAIVAVHYAGVGCNMDAILAIAQRRGIAVIEDNAHGLFGRYRGTPLGRFGCLSAQSFHETKNVICGEGGALVINDPHYLERAEIIREKGTDRSRFFRGEVEQYTWVDAGSSYVLSDVLAAFLYAQLERAEQIQIRRRWVWEMYARSLSEWATTHGVQLPHVPPHCEQPYHLFYLLMPSPEERTALLKHLAAQGIQGIFHYAPLHLSAAGMRFGGRRGDCPVAERVGECLLRLPFYNGLTHDDQMKVIRAVMAFTGWRRAMVSAQTPLS